jgi:hypothetical protein
MPFSRLFRLQAADSVDIYSADLGNDEFEFPQSASKIEWYNSFDALTKRKSAIVVPVGKVENSQFPNLEPSPIIAQLLPLPPVLGAPIYCWHELQNAHRRSKGKPPDSKQLQLALNNSTAFNAEKSSTVDKACCSVGRYQREYTHGLVSCIESPGLGCAFGCLSDYSYELLLTTPLPAHIRYFSKVL